MRLLSILLALFITGAVLAEDTPPPIPQVPADCKAVAGSQRPLSDATVQNRIKAFNQKAQEGGFDVMFIGDSITHCWEPFNPNNGEAVWKERIAPFKAANFGIGGDTTDTVIWRLDNGNLKGALDPKAVVIMLGTNNGYRDKPEETAAGIGAIITRIHERFPKAAILLYAIFPRIHPGGEVPHRNNQAVNKILATYHGHWNITFVDICERFMEGKNRLKKGVSWDGLHLTRKGYEIWADSLEKELSALLKRQIP
jgi:lysophospholipase L1-like esterase